MANSVGEKATPALASSPHPSSCADDLIVSPPHGRVTALLAARLHPSDDEPVASTVLVDGGAACSQFVDAVERWVSRQLREYAVAVRTLAYSQPNGVGETALLRLSEQMNTAADKGLGEMLASLEPRR